GPIIGTISNSAAATPSSTGFGSPRPMYPQQHRIRQPEADVPHGGHEADRQHEDQLSADPSAEFFFDLHPQRVHLARLAGGYAAQDCALDRCTLDEPVIRQHEDAEE